MEGRAGQDPAEEGGVHRVGRFRFYFDDDRWEWSEEVQRMHGYEPGTVTPTTEVVLSHKHPDDVHQVASTIAHIRSECRPLSGRHRIIDTAGDVHHVVVAGDLMRDETGAVVGTHGFYVDGSPTERAVQDRISDAVREIAKTRAVIEQAKGMIMAVYGVDAVAAFDVIKWRSRESNIKVRALADKIITDFTALATDDGLKPRAEYDSGVDLP